MSTDRPVAILSGVAAGTAGSAAFGVALGAVLSPFGLEVFHPGSPASQCVSVGLLVSACLVFARAGRPRASVLLAALLPAFFAASAWPRGPGAALASAAAGAGLGSGILIVAAVFDALGDAGWRFGRFLAAGPLLAGAYMAITPLAGLGETNARRLVASLWLNAILGFVIGDGAALGVEAVEAVTRRPSPGESAGTFPSGPDCG